MFYRIYRIITRLPPCHLYIEWGCVIVAGNLAILDGINLTPPHLSDTIPYSI